MKQKALWLGLMAVLLLWPTAVVFAEGPEINVGIGQVFVDEDVSLEPGETFQGDLGVLRGDLTIPQGSVVDGNVFVTDGDADIDGLVNGNLAVVEGDLRLAENGRVQGDVFVMRGDSEVSGNVKGDVSVLFGAVQLRSTAVVDGDLAVVSGSLGREVGAQILGQQMPGITLPTIPVVPEMPSLPEIRVTPEMPDRTPPEVLPERLFHQETAAERLGQFVVRCVTAGLLGLVFVAVGVLVAFAWPRRTHMVADCVAELPFQSLGLGLLTFLIASVLEALAVVLMILIILVAAALIGTVILIPVGVLLILLSVLVLLPVPVVLAGGTILGWIGLAELVGQRCLQMLKVRSARPLGSVLVGLLITVAVAATLWVIKPICCAWPFIILLMSVGLGSVIHTRFGTQGCRQPGVPAVTGPLPAEEMDKEAGEPDKPSSGTS